MKAFNRKRKPKHATKTKYCCLYERIYRQKYNYSKKRSCIDIVAMMFECKNTHFCIERYYPEIVLI